MRTSSTIVMPQKTELRYHLNTCTVRLLLLLTMCLSLSNIRAQSTSQLIISDLDSSQSSLKKIQTNYTKGAEEKAFKQLLSLYQSKKNTYLDIRSSELIKLKKTHKASVLKTIENADRILKNTFVFRHHWAMERTHIPHHFKKEIDWTAMPNGDPEWCYMLNRHRFLIDLGQAYALTGKEKYAKGFVRILSHWIKNNPLKNELKNVSWRRIEVGIRAETWIKAFEYVKNSKQISPRFFEQFISSLYQHATFLNSNFSGFSKTSNWGVLEFHGLLNIAVFLNEFKISNTWKENAIKNLSTCIDLQILEDGSQWEQSPMYHNEVFHCFLNVNLIAQRHHINLPKNIIEKTKRMAYANIAWQKPNFNQPMLGDSDNTDVRDLLTLATSIFKDPILKSRSFEQIDFDNQFVMNPVQKKEYLKTPNQSPPFLSTYREDSGDFYMRSSWKKNASYASFHLKKLGGGHGHDNILHFNIFAHGQDYLVDPGRFTYVNTPWRDYFKSSNNHNTLEVDGLPNSIYKDSWSNSFEAISNNQFTKSTPTFDYAEATNYAYNRLKDPVTTKRRLLFLKPEVWLIVDSFSGKESHTYTQNFIFPNDIITKDSDGIITTYASENLRIKPLNNVDITLKDAWFSSEYNLKTPSKKAVFSIKRKGFTSLTTLLYFPENTLIKTKEIPVYSRRNMLIPTENAEAISLEINDKKYILLVVHQQTSPANTFYKVADFLVRGEVVLIEINKTKNKVTIIK